MSRLNFWLGDDKTISEVTLENVINSIEDVINLDNSYDDKKLNFVREQLTLLKTKKHAHSYSPNVIITCFLLYSYSKSAFSAFKQTTSGLIGCCKYLLDNLQLNYVLLGSIQSDSIETRFGWIRQLSGGNYYVSCRQVLESDKKIRAMSLLKFSGFEEIENFVIPMDEKDDELEALANDIADSLEFNTSITNDDLTTLAYVCGAVVRSVCNTTKCKSCSLYLIDNQDSDNELQVNSDVFKFFNQIDHGGLTKPTEFAWTVCLHSYKVFTELKNNKQLFDKFMLSKNHMLLFEKITVRCLNEIDLITSYSNYCDFDHELNFLLCKSLFNCLSKNLVKTNSNVNYKSIQGKIKKLKS